MKAVLALMPLFAIAATDADEPSSLDDDATIVSRLAALDTDATPQMPNLGEVDDERCAVVIEQVRTRNGLPLLRREPADDEQPLLSAAVDRRIDGCPVIQMLGNPDDIRPFPEPKDEPRLRLLPAAE